MLFFRSRTAEVRPSGRIRLIIRTILAAALLLAAPAARAAVDFERLHGSDLGLGVGARAIGLGGAYVALADDASAVFWNPAGLARPGGDEAYLSADWPGRFSSAGLVIRPRPGLGLGLSTTNRLSFKGDSGSEPWDGYAEHIYYLAMVDPGDGFAGSMDSNTYDVRLSAGFSPPADRRLRVGANLVHVD